MRQRERCRREGQRFRDDQRWLFGGVFRQAVMAAVVDVTACLLLGEAVVVAVILVQKFFSVGHQFILVGLFSLILVVCAN